MIASTVASHTAVRPLENARMRRRSDGSSFPVAVSTEQVEVGGERARVLLVRDVSEEQERLRRREELFVNASHERPRTSG
jgi:PAS domain S-box-containing protein